MHAGGERSEPRLRGLVGNGGRGEDRSRLGDRVEERGLALRRTGERVQRRDEPLVQEPPRARVRLRTPLEHAEGARGLEVGDELVHRTKLHRRGQDARRLQVQERLTTQIANFLNEQLHPKGIAVVVEAVHLCTMIRGVRKHDARMTTSAMLGAFRKSIATRQEFLDNISRGSTPLEI